MPLSQSEMKIVANKVKMRVDRLLSFDLPVEAVLTTLQADVKPGARTISLTDDERVYAGFLVRAYEKQQDNGWAAVVESARVEYIEPPPSYGEIANPASSSGVVQPSAPPYEPTPPLPSKSAPSVVAPSRQAQQGVQVGESSVNRVTSSLSDYTRRPVRVNPTSVASAAEGLRIVKAQKLNIRVGDLSNLQQCYGSKKDFFEGLVGKSFRENDYIKCQRPISTGEAVEEVIWSNIGWRGRTGGGFQRPMFSKTDQFFLLTAGGEREREFFDIIKKKCEQEDISGRLTVIIPHNLSNVAEVKEAYEKVGGADVQVANINDPQALHVVYEQKMSEMGFRVKSLKMIGENISSNSGLYSNALGVLQQAVENHYPAKTMQKIIDECQLLQDLRPSKGSGFFDQFKARPPHPLQAFLENLAKDDPVAGQAAAATPSARR